jgi:hypothetical protein
MKIKKEVMEEPKDEVNYNYGDEESNSINHPFSPNNIYIYESIKIKN